MTKKQEIIGYGVLDRDADKLVQFFEHEEDSEQLAGRLLGGASDDRGGSAASLADGESFFLMRAEPGPGDDWISLYPYPAGRLDEMIDDADAEGELTTPRVVIIHPEMVAKIELLVEPDEARRGHLLGFRLHDDGE